MKIESQVVNLELSKQLKALGMKQESLYYWDPKDNANITIELHPKAHPTTHDKLGIMGNWFSAYTCSELGEMLPQGWYTTKWESGEWAGTCYTWTDKDIESNSMLADTEVDARALLLIYLIENKLYDN